MTEDTLKSTNETWSSKNINEYQNVYYHVDLDDNWPFGSDIKRGRWAGIIKPKNKTHANELYRLEHLPLDSIWYLYTFKFCNELKDENAIIFNSKVAGGSGDQIKINNISINNIVVILKETLE